MNDFEDAIHMMQKQFSRDYQFALATSDNNIPSLRYIDTYFDGECFYAVTYSTSQKMKDIMNNPNVALCTRKMHSFRGKAYNMGHPLLTENAEIRKILVAVFSPWYFQHNDEKDDTMCYLRIEPMSGFFHYNGIGYNIDFEKETAEHFPFSFNTVLTDE